MILGRGESFCAMDGAWWEVGYGGGGEQKNSDTVDTLHPSRPQLSEPTTILFAKVVAYRIVTSINSLSPSH